MLYKYDLQIPNNTAKSEMVSLECPLSFGYIRKTTISFPYGCSGLAHVFIKHIERQVYPSNPDESFNYDDYTIEIEDNYPILDRPFFFTVYGWNFDDTFNHTITFRFTVININSILDRNSQSNAILINDLLGDYVF